MNSDFNCVFCIELLDFHSVIDKKPGQADSLLNKANSILSIDFFVDFDHLSGYSDTLAPNKRAYLDGNLSYEESGERRDMVLTY